MNIELYGLHKHFLFQSQKQEDDKKTKTKTKKKEQNFYSTNEANICHKIKQIPYYKNFFMVLEEYDVINIKDETFEKIEKSKQYVLFTYKKASFSFYDFLQNTDPKTIFFRILHSFSYLLQSFMYLHEKNIVYFQFCSENIVFHEELRENPLLQNFQLSLQLSKLTPEYITNIINQTTDYSLQPLEVHLLFYLIKNNIHTISYSFIEEIVEVFVSKLQVLSFFSPKYKESFQQGCITSLKKYINVPKREIMLDILRYCKSWDLYSVSVFYLHIFATISRIFSLKDTYVNKIVVVLAKNIHPDPSKRGIFEELYENHEKLLNCDWSFIDGLDDGKMQELYDELTK